MSDHDASAIANQPIPLSVSTFNHLNPRAPTVSFRMFTVVAAFHVERPARITDRDSAGHPFPARELIGVNSGPSRCWSVRGSPGSPGSHRSCRSRTTLHQPGPATNPPSTRSEPPVSEPTNPHTPTGSRTYSPRRARPSAARFPLAVAATSPPAIPMPSPPRESIPLTP